MIDRLLGENIARLAGVLGHSARRHSVLASNVANVDTPGYLPVDVKFDEELHRSIALAGEHKSHIKADRNQAETVYDLDSLPGPDGNAVDLDREMAKLAENSQRYSTTSKLVAKKLAMIRYAIDGDR